MTAPGLVARWLCVGLCGLAPVVGCGTGIRSGIETANELIDRSQYSEAHTLLRNLLGRIQAVDELSESEQQQRLHILDRLGRVNWIYLQDYKRAIKDYQHLIELYPDTDEAYAARLTVADLFKHKFGNLEAAIGELHTVAQKFPDRGDTKRAHLLIAKTYFQLRDYPRARKEAQIILQRWPKSKQATEARFQIANSFYVEGAYREAIAMYQKTLDTEPDPTTEAIVFFELGNCFQELDDSERALAYFYECLQQHPDPLLVQRKIRRVRSRMNLSRPLDLVLDRHTLRNPAGHMTANPRKAAGQPAKSRPVREARTTAVVERPQPARKPLAAKPSAGHIKAVGGAAKSKPAASPPATNPLPAAPPPAAKAVASPPDRAKNKAELKPGASPKAKAKPTPPAVAPVAP